MRTKIRVHMYGLTILLLTLLTTGGVGFDQYENRKAAECQAKYNFAFNKALQARSTISDSDRNSMADLVEGVFNATTRDESRLALQHYLDTKAVNDKARAQNPLPSIPPNPHC